MRAAHPMANFGSADPHKKSMHKFGKITSVMDSYLCQLGRGSHPDPALRIDVSGSHLGSSLLEPLHVPGARFLTESLILAQDERWRRA